MFTSTKFFAVVFPVTIVALFVLWGTAASAAESIPGMSCKATPMVQSGKIGETMLVCAPVPVRHGTTTVIHYGR